MLCKEPVSDIDDNKIRDFDKLPLTSNYYLLFYVVIFMISLREEIYMYCVCMNESYIFLAYRSILKIINKYRPATLNSFERV